MAKKKVIKTEKTEKPNWELLYQIENKNVDNLLKIYKENPLHARVLFCQDKTKFSYLRVVRFEKPNGDFQIIVFTIKFGVSITNRIYSSQSKQSAIFYSKKKFWFQTKINRLSQFKPLTFKSLQHFFQYVEKPVGQPRPKTVDNPIYLYFKNKFFWVKMIQENSDIHHMSFNTIVTNKLFGYNDVLKYYYKCPLPIVKILKASPQFGSYPADEIIKVWKEMKKVLINLDRLTPELFNHHLFKDTCKMASSLGEKVNCAWGEKRLKEEHDKWSKQITKIIADFEPLQILKIKKVFKAFAEFSGYKMFETNRELIAEGMVQNHCVATYVNKIDNGDCGIYHVDGYTLQICIKIPWSNEERKGYLNLYQCDKILYNAQFRGKFNKSAPAELVNKVNDIIEAFNINEVHKFLGPFADEKNVSSKVEAINEFDVGLPF